MGKVTAAVKLNIIWWDFVWRFSWNFKFEYFILVFMSLQKTNKQTNNKQINKQQQQQQKQNKTYNMLIPELQGHDYFNKIVHWVILGTQEYLQHVSPWRILKQPNKKQNNNNNKTHNQCNALLIRAKWELTSVFTCIIYLLMP